MFKSITIGNRYGILSICEHVCTWISGYDVCIEQADKRYFYQLRHEYYDDVKKIAPVEFEDAKIITWEQLDDSVRKFHFNVLYPNGTETERNIFVYGKEEGERINAENEWADAHTVYNRSVTLRLAEKLGHFEKVQLIRSYVRSPENGYKNHVYVIDNKWQVTVSADNFDSLFGTFYATYTIEDYEKNKEVPEN